MLLAVRELGKTLFESSEYASRNRDNHGYVYDLYKTYLARDPDSSGWAFWENECSVSGREQVRRAFDECAEFAGIVATLTPSGPPSSSVSSIASARVDPFNQPGNGLASRDAEWSISLLSLPGRAGLDLGLSLSYSSMVWTRSGPYIYFDEDNGWPSPGFHLGFPRIQKRVFDAEAGRNVYLFISGGSRVSLRQVGTSNTYEAADSSYLQLIDYSSSLLVRTTDGTQLSYQSYYNEWHCTQIKDRNGNYLTINYDWLGHITTIIDTLARTMTFNYDSNANLLSVTQPWTVNGVSTTHTWASFGWTTKTISPSFSGALVVGANPATFPVISQVGLADGTHYTFEYNPTGQLNPLRSYRSDNVQRAYTAFDYDSPAADCPRLIDTHTWAENWTGINGVPQEVAVDYGAPGDGSHTMTTMDGTVLKEFYGTGWQRGLVTQTEIWGKDNPNDQSSAFIRQKWTANTWTQDNTGVSYQSNPRVTETNIFDASGNRRRATTTYASFTLPSGASCPLATDTRDYASDAVNVLRHSHVTYKMDPAVDTSYLDRHIIGLVREQTLYEVSGGGETLLSKVGFFYDETGSILGNDAPVRHDTYYDSNFVLGRANLTSVKRYDVTDTSQWTVSSAQYNTAGAVVKSIDPLGHFNTASYTDSFSDGNNGRNTLAYPKTTTDADGYSTTLIYNFDFGALTSKQTPQPNATQNTPGPIQTFVYDAATRIERTTGSTNGAYTRYVYGPNYALNLSTVNNIADEAYSASVFDGMGRTIVAARNHPGSSGGYSAVNKVYDKMGNAVKQSNPTETTSAWLPAGDDQTGWLYTQQTSDWKGRPLRTTNTDGTYKELSYSSCGCAGGDVATLTDEGTIVNGEAKKRQQKIYRDVLGRTVKSEILNWQGGSVYSTIINSYNARDQITRTRQFDAAQGTVSSDPTDLSCPSGSCQQTTLAYDGYGRLKTKHSPQQLVDENNSASTDFDSWDYNADDTVQKMTDARGVATSFGYNSRGLVTNINYELLPGVPATGVSAIAASLPVTLSYDAAGNRKSMTDGLGSVAYSYDQISRLATESRSITGVGTFPVSYSYNLGNQLTSVVDPFSSTIGYGLDTAGRLNGVTGSGFGGISTYASDIRYRAGGALKHLTYGNARGLDMTYDSRLRPAHFEIGGTAPNQLSLASLDYQYYADGQLKHVDDLRASQFTRGYFYDQVGRITEATSGVEAGGGGGAPQNSPYRQTYGFDVWNNTTSRTERHWSRTIPAYSATYLDNRDPLSLYDADGRPTGQGTVSTGFNAAGRPTSIIDSAHRRSGFSGLTLNNAYDGDGKLVKQIKDGLTTYFLRSSVLRGQTIVDIGEQGQKKTGYVYAHGRLFAKQNTVLGVAEYQHGEPSQSSEWLSFAMPDGTSAWGAIRLDPLGNDMGDEDPYLDDGGGGPSEQPLSKAFPMFGDPGDLGFGCRVDGQPWPCTMAFKFVATNPNRVDVSVAGRYIDTLGGLVAGGGMLRWNPGNGTKLLGSESHQNADGSYGASVTVTPDENDGYFDWVAGNPSLMASDYFERPLFPQKPRPNEFTPQQFERFKSCLSTMFKVYYQSHKFESGGEATFQGHSDSRRYLFSLFAIGDFTVRTDQQSYSTAQLHLKRYGVFGDLGGGHVINGFTDSSSPNVNAIAYDAVLQGSEALGLWVHELGNSLRYITRIVPEAAADAADRYDGDTDAGTAFEDCVFGGHVTKSGILPPKP